jgi:WD40 repeat protein
VVWQTATGNALPPPEGTESRVDAVAFAGNGKMLAVVKRPDVILYETVSGKKRATLKGACLDSRLPPALSPNGNLMAFATRAAHVRVLDLLTSKEPFALPGHTLPVILARFLPDGKTVLSVGDDGMARVWEAATGKLVRDFPVHRDPLVSLKRALSLDGKTLAVCHGQDGGSFYKVATGKEIARWQGWSGALAFAPDGKLLAVAERVQEDQYGGYYYKGSYLRLLNTGSGVEVHRFELQTERVSFVAFTPDGRALLTAGTSSKSIVIQVWDVASGKKLHTFGEVSDWPVFFRHEDRALVMECLRWSNDNGPMTLWDPYTGKPLGELPMDTSNHFLAQSPDGRLLAVNSRSENGWAVLLREIPSCKRVRILDGHPRGASAGGFSADGRYLVTAGDHGVLLIWDLKTLAQDRQQPKKKISGYQLQRLWEDLGYWHAGKSELAVDTLVDVPEAAIDLCKKHLAPIPHADVGKLIADLDAEQSATRQAAAMQLARLEFAAQAPLQKTLQAKPTLELRQRAEELLAVLDRYQKPQEWIRSWRAVRVLERVGTPDACQLLEKLAGGAPGARLTQEAQAALKRLKRKPPATP